MIALALGGRDTDDNLQPLCTVPCHARKTAHDIAAIAEAKRRERKNLAEPEPGPIRSAGFTGWRGLSRKDIRRPSRSPRSSTQERGA